MTSEKQDKQALKTVLLNSQKHLRSLKNAPESKKHKAAQKFAYKMSNLDSTNYPAFMAFSALAGSLNDQMGGYPQMLDKQTFLDDYGIDPKEVKGVKQSNDNYFVERGISKDGWDKISAYTYHDALCRICDYLSNVPNIVE